MLKTYIRANIVNILIYYYSSNVQNQLVYERITCKSILSLQFCSVWLGLSSVLDLVACRGPMEYLWKL